MRFDNRSSLVALVLVTMGLTAACQSRGSGAADTASAERPPADTTPAMPSGPRDSLVRADSVVLRTDKTQYRAGEAMTLTLENRSASSFAFNPCTRSVEREENGSWVAVEEGGRMCTMEAWILNARGTRTGPTELPTPLPAGRYRVVVRMTREQGGTPGSAVAAVSDPIMVQ